MVSTISIKVKVIGCVSSVWHKIHNFSSINLEWGRMKSVGNKFPKVAIKSWLIPLVLYSSRSCICCLMDWVAILIEFSMECSWLVHLKLNFSRNRTPRPHQLGLKPNSAIKALLLQWHIHLYKALHSRFSIHLATHLTNDDRIERRNMAFDVNV